MLTDGYELSTAITNILIFLVSIYGFFNIKKNKLWKLFFGLMTIDSFLGVIVHGINMTIQINILLWLILAILFAITINTYLVIFLKLKTMYIPILSLLLSLLLLLEIHYSIDFILTFTLYVLLSMIVSVYCIFKQKYKNKDYYLLAIVFQFIGGILMLSDIKVGGLNHNGIYHLFMTTTMIMFYIGIKKDTI